MRSGLKLMFIPVSSKEGIGEYMRSRIFADEVARAWPDAQIHFVLNELAPYAHSCPYITHLLNDTPTKKVAEVNQLMTDLKPDVVIFDASGRQSQLQHASQLGAKVIFISQHKRKRSRGMKFSRAKYTDLHWVAQPEFAIQPITRWERWKLKVMDKPEPIAIGPVFTNPCQRRKRELLEQYALEENRFYIFNSGSGGHCVDGHYAADIFSQAAQLTYQRTGVKCLMLFGPNYPNPMPELDGVISIKQMDNTDFISLLSASKSAILSGGDTLLQALALRQPTIAVPVSKDQPARIKACERQKAVISCACNVAAIVKAIEQVEQQDVSTQINQGLQALPSMNGLAIGMQKLEQLFPQA